MGLADYQKKLSIQDWVKWPKPYDSSTFLPTADWLASGKKGRATVLGLQHQTVNFWASLEVPRGPQQPCHENYGDKLVSCVYQKISRDTASSDPSVEGFLEGRGRLVHT